MHTFKVLLVVAASFIGNALANNGDATWFFPGLGSCGIQNTQADFIVALNPNDFGGKAACGRNIRVNFQGRSVNVQVVDLCPGCGPGGVDLSPAAFQQLADLGVGRIPVEWDFI
ncbi:hypothetical protein P691DRAFT_776411 [Macrolepiota fuliginosa MF-IS2]|uniref:RlpA-like protein double-psi beta-barrel domain-containing protein n=1 Tax=Macrolepiota fuliginosa MF-IS2 TaxID=1400762 RepID=A0A9P6C319_9AGAR|nr:hypothetical protein P691DRAFT_776411 [Macrolepiota fuliginosa MF-IS2]